MNNDGRRRGRMRVGDWWCCVLCVGDWRCCVLCVGDRRRRGLSVCHRRRCMLRIRRGRRLIARGRLIAGGVLSVDRRTHRYIRRWSRKLRFKLASRAHAFWHESLKLRAVRAGDRKRLAWEDSLWHRENDDVA